MALQVHCGQGHGSQKGNVKGKKSVAFEVDTMYDSMLLYIYVYILFIYSKVVHLVSQPDGEVKPQS